MPQFVEFEVFDHLHLERTKMLINIDSIQVIAEKLETLNGRLDQFCSIRYSSSHNTYDVIVHHTFDEVKKRLGMAISPRAETLAIGN